MSITTESPLPCDPRALRVLVADDIQATREVLVQQVQALGHEVMACNGGIQAIECVQQHAVDVVLLDLWMPEMDGFETMKRLRQVVRDRWLPVIVTSALEGDGHFLEALSRGADDYLLRPVKEELLKARLVHFQRVLALQANLTRLSQRERLVHEHMPDCVLTFDEDALLCEANRSARQMLTRQGHEHPIGLHLGELLGPAALRWSHGDNVAVPMSADHMQAYSVSLSEWSSGREHLRTLVLRDRTEQQRVERMKEEFLATVSHELRTPLTSIIGAISLLHAGAAGPLTPTVQNLLDVAHRNGERLSRLVDDVLDLTKLEGDRIQLQLRARALRPLIEESVRINHGYAHRGGVTLVLAECQAAARADIDADRFMQVLDNLLSNAIKHSPRGAQVRISLKGCSEGWRIEVSDQGPGVSPEFRQRLFEKFSQEDSSDRRQHQGTGLGLYITRMLVDRMGGQIGLDETARNGATFYVTLPRARDADETCRILAVARDASVCERWNDWLQDFGQVFSCADADQAADWVAQHGPADLVVADPQSQGSADLFCERLSALCASGRLLLAGDGASEGLARRSGTPWVAPGEGVRQRLQHTAAQALHTEPENTR